LDLTTLTCCVVRGAFALSGEPMSDQVASNFGPPSPEYTASQIAAVNVEKRQYQKEYMEYWNSTSALTGTGRPVEAVIGPVAPFAAARPNMYKYYGMCFYLNSDYLSSKQCALHRAKLTHDARVQHMGQSA
jgi:amidase